MTILPVRLASTEQVEAGTSALPSAHGPCRTDDERIHPLGEMQMHL